MAKGVCTAQYAPAAQVGDLFVLGRSNTSAAAGQN